MSKNAKPVASLSKEDFLAFPVWEHITDEEGASSHDETWVHPVQRKSVPQKAYSQLVDADFRTASGRELKGFMVVTTARDPVEISPGALLLDSYVVLPTVSRHVAIKENYAWSLAERRKVLEALDASESKIFPLTYRLKVAISGESVQRTGVVD